MKSFSASVVTLALILWLEAPVDAYLDPGSGSMLVQLLLGGVAGAAVMLKLGWQRVRLFLTPQPQKERDVTPDE